MENTLIIFGAKYLVFLMIAIAIFAFAFIKNDKKKTIIFAALVLPVSFVVARILSFFFYNPRPFVSEKITPLLEHAADNGFPSDHTLLASAIAAVIFSFNKKIGIVLWVLTMLVGASRVLAGVHHIPDIAGSILIVLVVSILSEKILLPLVYKMKK